MKNKNVVYYVLGLLLCTIPLASFTVFQGIANQIILNSLLLFSLAGFCLIEGLTLDDLEKTDDFFINFVGANFLVIFPILMSCFIVFCIIFKLIFFHNL